MQIHIICCIVALDDFDSTFAEDCLVGFRIHPLPAIAEDNVLLLALTVLLEEAVVFLGQAKLEGVLLGVVRRGASALGDLRIQRLEPPPTLQARQSSLRPSPWKP